MRFDGTGEEFEAIVNQNKLLLYSIAYAVAGNAAVDDIVQIFIYLWQQAINGHMLHTIPMAVLSPTNMNMKTYLRW